MNKFLDKLNLDNCIKIEVGHNTILLDSFGAKYNGGFGADSIVIQNKKGYFSYGVYGDENTIVNDLKRFDIEVYSLGKYIKDKIYEKVIEALFDYTKKNKDKQLFNKENTFIWRDFDILGENPLNKIQDDISFQMYFDDFKNDEIILSYISSDKSLKYNLLKDKFYINEDDYLSNEKELELVLNSFVTDTNKNLYVLYHNYINNNLKGEDLAYKEIADLNKWFKENDKVMVNVVYKTENYDDLEDMTELSRDKVRASTNGMFSDLSREYYEEMFSFWGVDNIKTIKQIRGFEYRNEFYKLNVNNLLYKKEVK